MRKWETKEAVIAELRRLESEGHSMRGKDFDNALNYAIRKFFGGYKTAKLELGIEVTDVRKGAPKKWTDARISDELAKVSEGKTLPSSKELYSRGQSGLVSAVMKRYGSWNAGIAALGYEPTYEFKAHSSWSRDGIIQEVLGRLVAGADPAYKSLHSKICGFESHMRKYFGTYDDFKREAGYCVIKTDRPKEERTPSARYTANLTSKEGLIREVNRLWYIGAPLNYNAIRERKSHILPRANELFGSWGEALNHAGIRYDDVKVADNSLSEAGYKFEEILGDILAELGSVCERFAHKRYDPDFVTKENEWYDAKLSEWTDYSEMLPKYLPECKSLTVVYLRGSKRDRIAGTVHKHRKVSVYKLIEDLDETRRKQYEDKLNEIEQSISVAQTG